MHNLTPGDIIEVPIYGFYKHYGVVTHAGIIINASKKCGKVLEETLADFCESSQWRKSQISSNLSPDEIIMRAKGKIGQTYCLLSQNCEHFVRYALGLSVESVQVKITLGLIGICLILKK